VCFDFVLWDFFVLGGWVLVLLMCFGLFIFCFL